MTSAWTYSQLESFETCPKRHYHLRVARDVVEPPSPHQEWGTKVHTAFENAINKGDPLPEGMQQWQALATKLQALSGEKLTEHRFAIDRNFQPVDWKSSWSRGIADLVVVRGTQAAVLDYKTGKRKPSEQLALYANYAFHHFPQVKSVRTGYVWLSAKKIEWNLFDVDSVSRTWQSFLPRVNRLEAAHEGGLWPVRPSGLCRGWCPVLHCAFNTKRQK